MTDNDQRIESSDRELVIVRTINAPRALVFAAYSTCEHLREWYGPRSWPIVECTIDFRVGGVWHYCLRGPNEGDVSWGLTVFEEIIEPERLVYTEAHADAQRHVNENMPQTRFTVEFVESEGKTVLTIRAMYPSAANLKYVLEMGMMAWITETFDRLDEHLASHSD